MLPIEKKFRESVRANNLLKKRGTVIVGVSGGPDSVALLYLLTTLAPEYRLSLRIAHLDHGLRADSGADARFVRALGNKLGIPVTLGRAHLKRAVLKGSLEEAAREARFAFFFRCAARVRADTIALGHNLDDQAETVLMRLLRGTGLCGLSAIIPKRLIKGYTVIRPLLSVPRSQIESYLRRTRICPRRDPTNDDEIFTRNKLRKSLIPFLQKHYSRNIKEHLAHLAESAGCDYEYIRRQAAKLPESPAGHFSLKKLLRIHSALRRVIFREAVSRLKGSTRRLTFTHIREIDDLLYNRPADSIVDLPQGVSCRKTAQSLVFYLR